MNLVYNIPEPFIFNPLKHHLGFIKTFVNHRIEGSRDLINDPVPELKRLGSSVMDVYTGSLPITDIYTGIYRRMTELGILNAGSFGMWAGIKWDSFRIITLTDGSQWTLKYHKDKARYVHFFPARNSIYTFRVKSNTLKTAILYCILIGKDYITGDDLNKVRPLLGLSPVKGSDDTKAILEMIEILRS